jgi:ornithine cyclodeaminase/alanine dehydrogenase-like protein (mu-crystallin family)
MLVLREHEVNAVLDMDAALEAVRRAQLAACAGHGEVLAKSRVRRLSRVMVRTDITVFCSHGIGTWDVALAATAVKRAQAAGLGVWVPV